MTKADLQPTKTPEPILDPSELLKKFLKENNLVIEFAKPTIRYLDDNSFLVEKPRILIGHGKGK